MDNLGSHWTKARVATTSQLQQEQLSLAFDELWPEQRHNLEIMSLCGAACPALDSSPILIISLVTTISCYLHLLFVSCVLLLCACLLRVRVSPDDSCHFKINCVVLSLSLEVQVGDQQRLVDCPAECWSVWKAHIRAAVLAVTESVVMNHTCCSLVSLILLSLTVGVVTGTCRQQQRTTIRSVDWTSSNQTSISKCTTWANHRTTANSSNKRGCPQPATTAACVGTKAEGCCKTICTCAWRQTFDAHATACSRD